MTHATPLKFKESAVWAIVLAAILVVTFNGFFFRNEILMPSDIIDTLTPWKDHLPADAPLPINKLMYDPVMAFRPDFLRVQESFRAGIWPLWNDKEYCGIPLLANCQSAVFYPPHLLLLVTDVDTAMSLFIVIKLWLAAFVAFVCARLLGFNAWPARWYSIVWGLGCFTHLWAYWPITDVLVWVPLVFLGTEWIAERRFRKGIYALALGGTLLLFAGHPETAFAINAYIALYFIARVAFAWKAGIRPARSIVSYATAWTLAISVYAIQLLPFAEYLQNVASVEQRIQMPLTASALTSLWVPRFFGTNAENTFWDMNVHNSNLTIQQYAGMASWLGIAFVLFYLAQRSSSFDGRSRARVTSILVATLASFAMAMDMPFLEWAHNLPGFSHMRTIYHVYFAIFAIPLLGVIGLDAWFASPRRLRETAAQLVILIPVAALVYFFYSYNANLIHASRLTPYVQQELFTALAFALTCALVLAAHCFTKRTAFVWIAIICVSLCDVYWPVRGLNPSLPRANAFPVTPLIQAMQEKPAVTRFDVLSGGIVPGTIGNFGIEEWDGYDGLYPARPVRFREELATQIWEKNFALTGVDYYLNDPRREELVPIGKLAAQSAVMRETTIENIEIYKHTTMLPRARLVTKLETASSTDALFERMLEDSFDPATIAITDAALPMSPLATSPTAAGTVAIREHTPQRVVIDCDAKSDALLVLADTFYPGWQASVDGKRETVMPVYHCFRGVAVPAGKHTVAFSYRPASVKIGFLISAVALVVSSAIAFRALRLRS
ncbi:MAG: YfhO family protein [Candidatus Hydrogenedentes bacterium]|nr:YfhO family protein [Candidatus Hydrogenedentota bacterium]